MIELQNNWIRLSAINTRMCVKIFANNRPYSYPPGLAPTAGFLNISRLIGFIVLPVVDGPTGIAYKPSTSMPLVDKRKDINRLCYPASPAKSLFHIWNYIVFKPTY